jgi:ribosomal protein L37AE/L43A
MTVPSGRKNQIRMAIRPGPYEVARLDEQGREYRSCPVCGSNTCKQDRIWTCENRGYAYEE